MLGHKLNITNGCTGEFKSIGNSVCKNNVLLYFLPIFFIVPFFTVITERIFSSVFTDGYCGGILSWENSPQFTNKIFYLVCLFVFINFLAVIL